MYNERGWNLQELVLSGRALIFINGQVCFRCHEANWSEETCADRLIYWLDADDSNISRMPDSVDGFLPSFWAYQKLCEDFSQRKLRNDEDTLRAFRGIERPVTAGMETDLVEGLPSHYLDHLLLFISTKGNMRRRRQFASFSWAGWAGSKIWPRENFEVPEASQKGSTAAIDRADNILQFFEHYDLVHWTSIDMDSNATDLTAHRNKAPSKVLQLMTKHPETFPGDLEDPV